MPVTCNYVIFHTHVAITLLTFSLLKNIVVVALWTIIWKIIKLKTFQFKSTTRDLPLQIFKNMYVTLQVRSRNNLILTNNYQNKPETRLSMLFDTKGRLYKTLNHFLITVCS